MFIDVFGEVALIINKAEGMLSKFIGRDIANPMHRAVMGAFAPKLKADLKKKVSGGIGGFAESFGEGSTAEADRLRAELDAARANFNLAHETALEERKAAAPKARELQLDEELATATASVAGTFSASAAKGIAGGGKLEDIAANTKQANQHLRKIANGFQPGLAVS